MASMDTEQLIVGAMSDHPGTPKAKARTKKARTERTGKAKASKLDLWMSELLGIGAFHASRSRVVRSAEPLEQKIFPINKDKERGHVKCAAATVLPLDLADDRPEHNHHSKGSITASAERLPDIGAARLKCTDELDVNRSITGRYTDVRKILANTAQITRDGSRGSSRMRRKMANTVVKERPSRDCPVMFTWDTKLGACQKTHLCKHAQKSHTNTQTPTRTHIHAATRTPCTHTPLRHRPSVLNVKLTKTK